MGDILGGLPPLNVGVTGLLALVFLLMLTGKIPTLRELRDSQDRERRAMELADKWQAVATEQGMTLSRLLDYAETTDHALTEIQSVLRVPGERAEP
ncbi:hypothetical protein [Blastococcus sp. CT_GayMR16]|uniref:hypothetical protein n=1 Tax=Blastococcus sp. CT_GayMR16 TaxID=2559607 RepID=UPI001073944A|nr:hypothetical protein [Blastococcus sp. CT_GayMR16]TFV91418.1 hypothetical protein E4P38_02180 [Blastococcus sp. CT_GayMR16]